MIKTLLRSVLLVLGLLLLKPTENQAQAYCPLSVYNNNQYVGLVNTSVYNTFVDGDYLLTMFSTNLSCFIVDETVHFTRTTNVSNYIPGAPASAGVVFSFSGTACSGALEDDVVQTGGLSISVVRPSDGVQVFTLNFWENMLDECLYTPLPVTFVSVDANYNDYNNYTRVEWTTNSESNMDHFTIEKAVYPGGNWIKVGQVAAQNVSSYNYAWNDYSPIAKAMYRITGVDLDCDKTYSRIRVVFCPTCPQTWTAPSLTPDCTGANNAPVITGPANSCESSQKLYHLNNVQGELAITWALSPASLGTVSDAGRMALITPAGFAGVGTLTASYVKSGQTYTHYKTIVFGVPPLNVSVYNAPANDGSGNIVHYASVELFPGTNWNEYAWYQGSNLVALGPTNSWTFPPGNNISYNIRWNGPCGQSIHYGSTLTDIEDNPEGRMAPVYTVTPNPAKGGTINISIKKRNDNTSLKPSPLKIFSSGRTMEIQVYDMYGNLKKSARVQAGDTRLTIHAPELPTGLYYLHVTEPGQKPVKLKVWIEK